MRARLQRLPTRLRIRVPLPERMDIYSSEYGGLFGNPVLRSGDQTRRPSMYPVINDQNSVTFQSHYPFSFDYDSDDLPDIYVMPDNENSAQLVSYTDDGFAGSAMFPTASVERYGQDNVPRWIAFVGMSDDFIAGDSNGFADIFVRDMDTDVIQRVSVTAAGAQAVGGHSYSPAMSSDGAWITFISSASNLVPGDSNGLPDIFVVRNPLYVLPPPAPDACAVNVIDFSQLAARYGATIGAADYDAGADRNADGAIDSSDLALLVAYFGQSACP